MKNGKRIRDTAFERVRTSVRMALVATLCFCGLAASSQVRAQDYGFVKANLDWSAGDHGFKEGGLCGANALRGIAGIQLPNVPFEYQILGNVWDRTNMMNAAQAAFRMGFVDAAVSTAICSQIHNAPVQQALARRPDLIIAWFQSR